MLVIEPGTSGGGAYFVPLAKWIVEKAPGWQVWAVERRENLLENQKELNKFKNGKSPAAQFFHYYLGYLGRTVGPRKALPAADRRTAVTDGGRQWGMNVAVEDLHVVIEAAKALGGKVVLARPLAGRHGGDRLRDLGLRRQAGRRRASPGLVYIDGGSSPIRDHREASRQQSWRNSNKAPLAGVRGNPGARRWACSR